MATPFITDAEATQKIQQSYNQLENKIDGISSGYRGTIAIADTPTEDGIYTPTEDGTYTNAGGLVYDPDGVDKGFDVKFIKTGSTWEKSVVEISFEGDDYVPKVDAQEVALLFDNTIATIKGYVNASGDFVDGSNSYRRSDYIDISEYSKLYVTTFAGASVTIKPVVFYDSSNVFISSVANITTGVETYDVSVPSNAKYAVFSSTRAEIDNFSVKTYKYIFNENRIKLNAKADTTRVTETVTHQSDYIWENKRSNTTEVYENPKGVRPNVDFRAPFDLTMKVEFNSSIYRLYRKTGMETPAVGPNIHSSQPSISSVVQGEYVAFEFARIDGEDIDLNTFDLGLTVTLTYTENVATDKYVGEKILEQVEISEAIDTKVELLKPSTPFQSSFRTPDERMGGVITIIDDDGRLGAYTDLYPFLKAQDIPLGLAIITSVVGSDATKINEKQLKILSDDKKYVEIMNHTKDHINLATLTEEQINEQIYDAHSWFTKRGHDVSSLVLPFGGHNALARKVVQRYYDSCYDFGVFFDVTIENIMNRRIYRFNFNDAVDRVEQTKAKIDNAIANNGWLVITTHTDLSGYWNETSLADLQTVIDYANSQNVRFMKPREAFQIFGNMLENESGFAIQADGVIRTP